MLKGVQNRRRDWVPHNKFSSSRQPRPTLPLNLGCAYCSLARLFNTDLFTYLYLSHSLSTYDMQTQRTDTCHEELWLKKEGGTRDLTGTYLWHFHLFVSSSF